MTGTEPVFSFPETLQDDLCLHDVSSLRRICFTGVRGVGKSSVLKEINNENIETCFTSGSDILQEMMGDVYFQFEYLPEYKKYAYRLKIRETLQRMQEEGQKDLLVDSHLTVYNLNTGKIDVIFTYTDYSFYTDMILLDSYPERVLDHRQRDTKKKRITDLDIIQKELEFERHTAIEISRNYGIRLHVIQMGEGAARGLERILKGN